MRVRGGLNSITEGELSRRGAPRARGGRTSVFPRQDGAGPTFDAVAGDSLLVASATASTAQLRASCPPLTSSLGDAVLGAAARSRPPGGTLAAKEPPHSLREVVCRRGCQKRVKRAHRP